MAKPELGTKRLCLSCGTKYYDLNRDPAVCPKCATVFAPEEPVKVPEKEKDTSKKPAAEAETADAEDDDTDVDGPEIISLEDAEDDDDDTVDGDDIPDDIPDVEIEDDDDDAADDNTFLDDDDDETNPLSDIIPAKADDEET